jgi:signal peptidase I
MSVVRKIAMLLVTGLFCGIAVAGGLAWYDGYRLYIVHTGSMAPRLLAGDVVLDGPATGAYHRGEIITFRHSDQNTDLVTHRVDGIQSGKIETKGDANRTADAWDLRPDQIRGVFVERLPRLGYLIVFLRQPTGIAAVIALGLALILFWGLINPSSPKETPPDSGQQLGPWTPAEMDATVPG